MNKFFERCLLFKCSGLTESESSALGDHVLASISQANQIAEKANRLGAHGQGTNGKELVIIISRVVANGEKDGYLVKISTLLNLLIFFFFLSIIVTLKGARIKHRNFVMIQLLQLFLKGD